MTDERTDEPAADGQTSADGLTATDARQSGGHPEDPRAAQRNLAERLFPGPSKPWSNQRAEHLEGLLRPFDNGRSQGIRRGKGESQATDGSRPTRAPREGRSTPAIEPLNVATPEDIAQVRDTLEQQNELLRALLASSVDTQEDARSTAQNSRTFAWAGTAIALLTLIATVVSVVAAINAG